MKLGLSAVAVLAYSAATVQAMAAECVHGPIALPMFSGPPDWAGAAGATDWRPQLHDPRWVGAPVRLFANSATGSGVLYNAQYRLLQHGGKLYVSIQVLADADHVPGNNTTAGTDDFVDSVYFGFNEGGAATGARVVAITPARGLPVAAPDPSVPVDTKRPVLTDAGYINWYDTLNTTPTPPAWSPHSANQPPWLEDVATWNISPGVTWAVTFKIDLAGANSLNTSKFFVGVRIGNGAGTTVKLGNSPLAATEAASINGETIVLPNEDAWVDYDVPGTPCATGAYIDYNHVGVVSGSNLVSTIQACGGAGTPCPAAGVKNKFRVAVQNVPNPALLTDFTVRANIRIADWGSTISNWQFAPWKPIAGISPTIFTDAASTLTAPTWDWDYTTGATHGEARIDFECTPAANSYCPKLDNPDGYGGDQCMLVEIAAAPGFQSQIPIATPSVYRNMQFVGLSTFEHKAKITIQGLQQLLGQAADRDVYLHVQTLNMPPHGQKPVFQNVRAMAAARSYAENPPNIPLPVVRGEKPVEKPAGKAPLKATGAAPNPPAHVAKAPPPPAAQPAQAQEPPSPLSPKVRTLDVPVMTPSQALEATWPTYKIYPYFDTGQTSVVKGQTLKLLEPMVPFGYYLEHDGPLYGFTHALEGVSGVVVTKVGENLYKVRIQNEGSVDLSTKITAEETPTGVDQPPCSPCKPQHGHRCHCDVPGVPVGGAAWLPALLSGLGLTLRRRRRSR